VSRWTDRVRHEVLSNGLTVLVQRDDSAPVASVVTHVKAGFFDEPDHWAGISHVLEHMFFKGTRRRGPGDVARETKAAGGYLNAGTGYDYTSYYVVLPASSLATALDIQSDALRNSVIDSAELARELQVIIQEAKRKLDSPSAVAHETLHEVMFDRHRIRRWRIGREDVLAGFTRDDLWEYYRSRYVPRRTIVSIVGAVDEDVTLDLARTAYGSWEDRTPGWDRSPEEPPHTGVRVRTLRGDVTHTHLTIGWSAVPPLHPDAPSLDLAAAVLGLGRGSWLYRALRETGLATSASSHYYAPTEIGVFGVAAECEPARFEAVMAAAGETVARLARQGPSEDDLDRARTLLLTRWARRLEPMEGRASALAEAQGLKHYTHLDEEYDALVSVTASQIQDVAHRYLGGDRVAGLVYQPEGLGADLDAAALSRAFSLTGDARPGAVFPRVTQKTASRATSGRTTAGVYHVRLAGSDLLIRRKTGVPTITLGLYVARSGAEDPALAGIGALAVRSAIRGAGPYDATGLAFAFEQLGGSLGISAASDWLGVGATVLADRVVDAAHLLRLVLTEATLLDSDILLERSLMVEEAIQVADDMFRYPFQLALGAAFGDTGYGLPVGGIATTLPNITPPNVREFLARETRNRLVMVAVGDVDPEAAAAQLAGVFADVSPRHLVSATAMQPWMVNQASAFRLVQRDKAQSAVAMAFPGPARRELSRYAAEVWAAVASGLGGRLFESLRSRRSLAYTVLASSWQRGRAGAVLTYIATAPEREAEAREEMLRELARFRDAPVSVDELSQAISYLAGQAEVSRQNAGSVSAEILEAWMIGDGLEELADPGARYREVTVEAVQEVASSSLVPERRAEGIVRGGGGGQRPDAISTARV
jgi:zinc protease